MSTLGFVIARHLYQEALKVTSKQDLVVEDMEVEGSGNVNTKHAEVELLTSSVEKLGLIIKRCRQIQTDFGCTLFNHFAGLQRSVIEQ